MRPVLDHGDVMGPTNSSSVVMPLTNSAKAAESCREHLLAELSRSPPLNDPLSLPRDESIEKTLSNDAIDYETIRSIALKAETDTKGCYMPIAIKSNNKTFWTYALIDSGASINVINPTYARKIKLATDVSKPMVLTNVDGTQNKGGIQSLQSQVQWKFQNTDWQTDTFRLVDIGRHNIILGYKWLIKYNPSINWKETMMLWNEHNPSTYVEGKHCNVLWELAMEPENLEQINSQHHDDIEIPDVDELLPIVPKQYHKWLHIFSK
jgi:hypothetical protein